MEKKNRFVILLMFFSFLTMVFVGCNKTSTSKNSSNDSNYKEVSSLTPSPLENDVLVVYFSYSGNTKSVADEIILQSNSYGVEIIPSIPYTDSDVNYNEPNSRSQTERKNNSRPEISLNTYNQIDMAKYETILIGYPIWNGYEPMIIRTFIEHYNGLSGKIVHTFSTSSSSSGNLAHNSISNMLKTNIGSNLHFTSSTLKDVKTLVHDWLLELSLLNEVQNNGEENMNIKMMIGNKNVDVNYEDNCATKALKEKLKSNSVKINMNDYGGFEKVGGLGFDLPTCNEQITTEPGDIVLYQGNQLVIFYGSNDWSYTRIGKIMGLQTSELKSILGKGSVTITLSLENN